MATQNLPDWFIEFCKKNNAEEKEIDEFYAKCSSTYDELLQVAGYNSPLSISKVFDTYAKQFYGDEKAKQQRILDIGAGTGLVGRILGGLGYNNIDAIDCCRDMLEKSKDENIYKKVIVGFVNEKKNPDLQDGEYDALISCGAISGTLIQAKAFDEMLRWLKKGGIFCFTLRSADYEENGYKTKFHQLEEEKKWKFVSKDEIDYVKNTDGTSTFVSKAFAFVIQKL